MTISTMTRDFDEVDLEDAADDEIDFVLAAYREDGQPYVQSLGKDLANDLDELIVQLRRLPGDAGALGFVSLVEEVFVIIRVRGQHVQVLLSDGGSGERLADRPRRRGLSRRRACGRGRGRGGRRADRRSGHRRRPRAERLRRWAPSSTTWI